jgi:hypothetical protein
MAPARPTRRDAGGSSPKSLIWDGQSILGTKVAHAGLGGFEASEQVGTAVDHFDIRGSEPH